MIELPRAADGRIRLILRTDGTMEVIEKPLNITQTREAIGSPTTPRQPSFTT